MSVIICRGHIRLSKHTFQIFLLLTTVVKIDVELRFLTLLLFDVQFEKKNIVNRVGGQN